MRGGREEEGLLPASSCPELSYFGNKSQAETVVHPV